MTQIPANAVDDDRAAFCQLTLAFYSKQLIAQCEPRLAHHHCRSLQLFGLLLHSLATEAMVVENLLVGARALIKLEGAGYVAHTRLTVGCEWWKRFTGEVARGGWCRVLVSAWWVGWDLLGGVGCWVLGIGYWVRVVSAESWVLSI